MTAPPAAATPCNQRPVSRRGRQALEGCTPMRCPGCGLEWLDPQLDDATLAQIYHQGYDSVWGLQANAEPTRALGREDYVDVRVGRAIKIMNLHCVFHQFAKYRHPLPPPVTLAH
jgi:hypothetical protein